ncbi:cytochrome P450 [Parendozoicomonas haliclonae]|uniref:Putative cytochrome P450 120 n=1 Tax=Parendozoicomonas haliclonae TaxID=1960125 RepID=A0A1X7AKB9_9GAMM|nr:cytochrome P450 [Parendozoicomonas haliclonae]SMA47729.1 putative cytochrome P450 120 [Parendozoicomonas haliclonae]
MSVFARVLDNIYWRYYPYRFMYGKSGSITHLDVDGWEKLRFFSEPDELKEISRNADKVFLGGAGNEFLQSLFGPESVFLLDGEKHLQARKIISSELTNTAVSDIQPFIDTVIQSELCRVSDCGRTDLCSLARFIALRIMCKLLLNRQDRAVAKSLFKQLEQLTGFMANIVSFNKRYWRARQRISVGSFVERQTNKLRTTLNTLILESDHSSQFIKKLNSVCDHPGFGPSFLIDNLISCMTAGYDTTGSALAWSLFWFGREAGEAQYLRTAVAAGDMKAIKYFRQEVLRYCPPIDVLPRKLRSGCEHSSDVLSQLEEGAVACPYIHRAHHRAQTYQNPERFSPQRFARKEGYSNNEFCPFGAGNRLCLGMNVGRVIMDRLLTILCTDDWNVCLSNHRFRLVRRNVSIWPGYPLKGKLIRGKISGL